MISPFSPTSLSLLFLATTAQAASSISLGGNFQQLPFGITGECRTVYNRPIEGCGARDFQAGGACSVACVASLESISNTLNTVCPGVIVDSRTLLGRIFQNMLIASVCNGMEVPTQSTAPTEVATKPTDTSAPTTTSQKHPQSTTAEAPTTTTSEAPKSSVLGIGDPDPTSESTTQPTTESTTEPTTESIPESTTSETQASQTTNWNKQDEPSGRSRQQQQIDANKFSGGGSPFDNIVADGGAVHPGSGLMMSLAGAILAAIILV
ncbi:hypothetical protein VC83_06510 [Pseudogymnoascus destructans]|uniref:Extracellular membrane protein CFEM domain-containing protein n=2 Tax=Pseudogymnoascus destructans TaxID=655981 RepID=L8GAC1_PSED2|nr:uncharacterized protein VC83_06510 [Pseudogymnoascus destructans]ELR09844.1 hypothetical protein GMDG_04324 [Pseudogymnoascus destructans 20631-21]OAF58423.1 hypothetical protein VC83_06510 [Pseudogymnoascus destructans]